MSRSVDRDRESQRGGGSAKDRFGALFGRRPVKPDDEPTSTSSMARGRKRSGESGLSE